jgi:hypothetical protein
LYKNNKNKQEKIYLRKTDLIYNRQLTFNQQKQEEEREQSTNLLYRKIDSITKTCSKMYLTKS